MHKSTSKLQPGDKITGLGGRTVDRIERNLDNLGAYLIFFTNGEHYHASEWDVHTVTN